MKETEIYEKVFALHDQTVGRMRALRLPPFPSVYKKHFDALFHEQADDVLKSALPCEDAASPSEELEQYLDLAHRAIQSFVESHADISHVSQLQQDYIEGISRSSVDRCMSLVEGLSTLGRNMTDELKKAQQKIDLLTQELQEAITLMSIDPLTQVGNRKGFMEDIKMILEAGEGKELPLVLMMIDADNFKLLNDEYGHVAGDKVLYFLAQSIKSIIRGGDRVYRFGGEEFAVVMNRCDTEQVFSLAEKIRTNVEGSHLIYAGKSIRVTVSIGVTVHRIGDTYESLVTRADDALYQAKKSRKNCTIFSGS